jgi:hypothetical protein
MKVSSILSIIIFSGFFLMMRRGGCGMGHGGIVDMAQATDREDIPATRKVLVHEVPG